MSLSSLIIPPKIEDPPQEEWGPEGLNSSIQALLEGSLSLPAPTPDSRLRGNDRTRCEGLFPAGGLGGILGACNAPLQRFAVMVSA